MPFFLIGKVDLLKMKTRVPLRGVLRGFVFVFVIASMFRPRFAYRACACTWTTLAPLRLGVRRFLFRSLSIAWLRGVAVRLGFCAAARAWNSRSCPCCAAVPFQFPGLDSGVGPVVVVVVVVVRVPLRRLALAARVCCFDGRFVDGRFAVLRSRCGARPGSAGDRPSGVVSVAARVSVLVLRLGGVGVRVRRRRWRTSCLKISLVSAPLLRCVLLPAFAFRL